MPLEFAFEEWGTLPAAGVAGALGAEEYQSAVRRRACAEG